MTRTGVLALIPARGGSRSIPRENAIHMPRQALPDVRWHPGYVDAVRTATIQTESPMTGDRTLPMLLDEGDRVDIDSPADRLWQEGSITFEDPGFTSSEVD